MDVYHLHDDLRVHHLARRLHDDDIDTGPPTMDALVAQYRRPAFAQNEPLDDEAQDLMRPASSLAGKFAMPPIAQVCRARARVVAPPAR